ncbi:restriction endonuclease type II-like protein [Mucor lusitanicus]|uniref:DNA excision repair protein ERCC-1 n=1 Tax=Mucor circinelloides f. lusitanicus TaxID=29924 RepID=A0A8H4BRW6_MUCCL|nr:restriction endonuclease type II-like protein [Mucor lusitanicus]
MPDQQDSSSNKPTWNIPTLDEIEKPTTPAIRRAGGNTILVNPTQQKNPILKHVHNVPWEPSEAIKMDYVVGQTTGVIYLSLRYHRLYPTYIYDRLNSVKGLYVKRILLVYVDVDSFHDALREINRIAILSDFTLMLAWSPEEAGRYLETYKAFENKAPDLIREKVDDEYFAKMTDCLTQIRSLNKTDVLTLLSTFGSLKQVAEAKADALAMCPGFGEQKVRRLQQTWKQPFLANKKQKKQ